MNPNTSNYKKYLIALAILATISIVAVSIFFYYKKTHNTKNDKMQNRESEIKKSHIIYTAEEAIYTFYTGLDVLNDWFNSDQLIEAHRILNFFVKKKDYMIPCPLLLDSEDGKGKANFSLECLNFIINDYKENSIELPLHIYNHFVSLKIEKINEKSMKIRISDGFADKTTNQSSYTKNLMNEM